MLISDVARLSNVACQNQKGSKSILFPRISSLGREVVDELCNSKNSIESEDEKDLSVEEILTVTNITSAPTVTTGNLGLHQTGVQFSKGFLVQGIEMNIVFFSPATW